MKIGILTLPIAENYGGILQAVALYRFLDSQGHEVILLYKEPTPVLWKEVLKSIFRKIPFYDIKNFKAKHQFEEERQERKVFHRTFVEQEIFKISKNLYTKKDLETFVKKEMLDAVVVGSDQVWRRSYIVSEQYYKSYFLDFVDSSKIKKIAYAASFGKDYWEGKDDIEEIAKYMNDFHAVSTRELSGVDICKNSFKFNDAKHVLDPTLLLGKGFYLEIISKYDVSSITKGGLVTYVLDEEKEKEKIINFLKENLKIDKVQHLKGFDNSKKTYSIPEWLASFAYADVVVTDSFHGMIFSIIFEKNFVVIGNHDRGLDRFMSLLSLLNLKDRLIFKYEDIENRKIENIDYKVVNGIIDTNKKISLDFLINALAEI